MTIAEFRVTKHALAVVLAWTAALVGSAPALAANYPLELVSPRAAATAPSAGTPAISGNNRIFWAYPGLEYNIRATVIGGAYPYSFSISGAPAGMTINAQTGEIRWPNATGSSVSPRISVTDSENVSVSATWTITVDANRFIFLDAVNGREFDASNPGTGTISNPFRRIRDLYSGSVYDSKRDARHVNKIAYFRTGTYYIDGYIEDSSSTNPGRMAVLDTAKPVAWVAYPGQSPIIDGQCRAMSPQIGSRPCNYGHHISFYGNGHNTYIDGLRLTNMAVHAFRVGGAGNYQVFRRNRFSVNGPTVESVNQGFIVTMSGDPGFYMTIQDNIFEDIDDGTCVKLYSTYRILVEDNVCRNVRGGESEGFAAKAYLDRVTIRHNVVEGVYQHGIGGNMHDLRSGEIIFNKVTNSGVNALSVNQDGMAGPIYIERNTIVGRVEIRNTDSADGPFQFRNNVIVNNDSGNHIQYLGADASRVITTDNLAGTPAQGIIDSSGMLTDAYAQYRGLRGHELGDTVRPAPPSSLRVE